MSLKSSQFTSIKDKVPLLFFYLFHELCLIWPLLCNSFQFCCCVWKKNQLLVPATSAFSEHPFFFKSVSFLWSSKRSWPPVCHTLALGISGHVCSTSQAASKSVWFCSYGSRLCCLACQIFNKLRCFRRYIGCGDLLWSVEKRFFKIAIKSFSGNTKVIYSKVNDFLKNIEHCHCATYRSTLYVTKQGCVDACMWMWHFHETHTQSPKVEVDTH